MQAVDYKVLTTTPGKTAQTTYTLAANAGHLASGLSPSWSSRSRGTPKTPSADHDVDPGSGGDAVEQLVHQAGLRRAGQDQVVAALGEGRQQVGGTVELGDRAEGPHPFVPPRGPPRRVW